jgi:hypothetical protein
MTIQDNIFTTVIQSSQLSEMPLNTKIYNSKDFSEIVCVKLPPQMPRDMDLIEIYNLNASEDVDFADQVTRDEHRPWVDISSSILDLGIGQHTYRMTFAKEGCKLKATCWFSYIIQDNNPEKPYIYMDRGENNEESSSSEG